MKKLKPERVNKLIQQTRRGVKIRPRAGTSSEWETKNPVLAKREIGFEYENAPGDGNLKMKMGNGLNRWTDLPYALIGLDMEIIEDSNTHLLFRIKNVYIFIFRDLIPLLNIIVPEEHAPHDPVMFRGFSNMNQIPTVFYLNPDGSFGYNPNPFSTEQPTARISENIYGYVLGWVK